MHPMFQALSRHCSEDSMLRDATLALSSCNFSRLHPDIKDTTNRYMGYFSPALVHQTRSQLYYSQAIRKFTALSEYECQNTPIVILTVLTIFAYIESSMGNFHGFNCHDQGMSSLLLNLNVSLKDPTLEALLAAWLQIRIVVWWGRAYFCSLQVLQHLPSALLPELLQDGSASPHRRRVTVLGIMCESHRLNFQRVLKHWEPTNTEVSEHQEHLGEVEDYTQTISKLAMQSSELDIWVSELPPSDLPIENHGHLEGSEMNLQENSIHFQSHEAALNYAYYVVGRIMQCTGLLEALRMNESPPSAHEFTEEEEWTLLLLRIVKGTDMQKSLTMNNYTIGFSGLLLTALLRCRSHSLGLEIQNWLQGLANLQSTEEGAFPLYQTLGVAKAINRQKEIYRDVLGATQPVDDDGGTPKFNAYNSQPISTLLFHGICKYSGALFSECVSIDI
ncbi:hypothetical protein N7532_010250 [Penicillium argentinense]|uniref:Transcription factor domain-containing protein n=1 Tax=Penicillium argentinense TaxID=1131581 RepID=A0A9W9EPL3_9EURO|nr:uncharacterized protein N7532_010250 [Penicillium argentinense]KAJ5085479.1 hypothetical protein N7532_010250 [Penicillium argentinense]